MNRPTKVKEKTIVSLKDWINETINIRAINLRSKGFPVSSL